MNEHSWLIVLEKEKIHRVYVSQNMLSVHVTNKIAQEQHPPGQKYVSFLVGQILDLLL